MIIVLSQIIILTLIIMFMVTQIIVPFIRGTSFLPMFSKEAHLQKELEDVRQESLEADMENEICLTREEIRRKLDLDKKTKKRGN